MNRMILEDDEKLLYDRQMLLDGFGEERQAILKGARVFVAGAGGLGSPASIYLSVAGVGNIRICDFDFPETSNLNRQILHDPSRIGLNKAVSGTITLARMNPHINIVPVPSKIDADNAEELVGDVDIIIDCMDNMSIRYILNRVAMKNRIPMVHASVWGLEGRLSFIHVPETPCIQCLFPEAPEPDVFPIMGATAGVIGSMQALETIKYLTGIGSNLKNKMLLWDGYCNRFKTLNVRKIDDCQGCTGYQGETG